MSNNRIYVGTDINNRQWLILTQNPAPFRNGISA